MNICQNVIYSCVANLYFQHHYCSLQCHMIFRNHNNMLICCSRNISDYYQCWKQLCCSIFLWKLWCILFFRIHRWIESSKEQHLYETEIFCNIMNFFTFTFDQFNASLMNKSINFFQAKNKKVNLHRCLLFKQFQDLCNTAQGNKYVEEIKCNLKNTEFIRSVLHIFALFWFVS